ncbi:unnamed protein product (macronuclear) [Paramecium tetraurelia]|uniref:Uncharacterized protein n=1 Tax=Paramecium tetraurelia TaxID=5888 RepID=A0EE21_PARTE|nr:uncharacterized protein GSPATT00025882001 [Paramecium tetraurelia]CAK93538.1 unnamed protein product [Paramecium tetraurelia]|eukprot:XP_001460935.1 hypothetical protein (macronuclear) [Paramecium tetraurelia strain d4-2]
MKKYSSQGLLLTNEELLRIQILAKNSFRPSSKQRIKEKPKLESYQFKPEINKQSANLQRSINDLFRWNLNRQMKRQQIYDDESRELVNNANRLTHELNNSSVFDRLYQVRKNSENVIQQSKRNTSNFGPYYTKNMTSSMYQEYQRQQQLEVSQFKSKTNATDSKYELSHQQTPNPNFLDSDQLPIAVNDQIKASIPVHQYVDLTEQLSNSMNEPDSPAKSPLHQKDIEVMVERLNNWQAKKQQQEQQDQEEDQHVKSQIRPNFINQNRQPSFGSSQSQSKFYSNMFLNNNQTH